MEENGHEYLVKMSSFLNTMNSRVNRSTGRALKEVKNTDFLSLFFYKKPISQYKNPRFKVGYKVRISKYDIPCKKGYKSQFKVKTLKL